MALGGDRARIRTWDRLLRRQMLYPAELRDQSGDKNRKNVNIKHYFFISRIL